MSAERLAIPSRASQTSSTPRAPRILDLCCGTGLSTEALRRAYPAAELVAVDASAGMLEVARGKASLAGVQFVHADAARTSAAGVSGPFDGIMVAYGVRNMSDPDAFLTEVRGLLAPTGVLVVHEYTLSGRLIHDLIWQIVSGLVVVPLGTAMTGTGGLFRYLRRSVTDFDRVSELLGRLRRGGFTDVTVSEMDGWQRGIVHTLRAVLPAQDGRRAA